MKFHEMTSPQISEIDRESTLVIVPISAVEQHGPHMPTGTDFILCSSIAAAVEEQLNSQVLLTPTVWLGASAHHLRFGATITASLDNYIATLCDIACSLLDDGFQRILFLNGHGGNVDPLRVALREVQENYTGALLAGGSYWSVADDLLKEVLEGDHKFVGHACEFETSMIMHLRPELVTMDQLADAGELGANEIDGIFLSRDMRQRTRAGCTGRPDLATPEKGKELFEGIVKRVTSLSEKLLQEPLGIEYKDFFEKA